VTAKCETEDGIETVMAPLPELITASEDLAPERFPSKADREAAKSKPCSTVTAAELGGDASRFGTAGSPTWVAGLEQIETARLGRIIDAGSIDSSAQELTRI